MPGWSGSSRYKFSRNAVVTSDSAGDHPLTLDARGEEIFTRAGDAHRTHVVISEQSGGTERMRLSATVGDGQLLVQSENASATTCDAGRNQLRSDLSDLTMPIPTNLSMQSVWGDSGSVTICIGGLPGTASSVRRFRILGDTALAGEAAIIVSRKDSTELSAEGTLDQHPVVAAGLAQTFALVYVSASTGRILRITKNQQMTLSVKAENRARSFLQKVVSALELER